MTREEVIQRAAESTASEALTLYANMQDARQGLIDIMKMFEIDESIDAEFREFSISVTKLAIIMLNDFIVIGQLPLDK